MQVVNVTNLKFHKKLIWMNFSLVKLECKLGRHFFPEFLGGT